MDLPSPDSAGSVDLQAYQSPYLPFSSGSSNSSKRAPHHQNQALADRIKFPRLNRFYSVSLEAQIKLFIFAVESVRTIYVLIVQLRNEKEYLAEHNNQPNAFVFLNKINLVRKPSQQIVASWSFWPRPWHQRAHMRHLWNPTTRTQRRCRETNTGEEEKETTLGSTPTTTTSFMPCRGGLMKGRSRGAFSVPSKQP